MRTITIGPRERPVVRGVYGLSLFAFAAGGHRMGMRAGAEATEQLHLLLIGLVLLAIGAVWTACRYGADHQRRKQDDPPKSHGA